MLSPLKDKYLLCIVNLRVHIAWRRTDIHIYLHKD